MLRLERSIRRSLLDEWAQLKKGNVAVGIVMAAIVISISTIVSQGVASIIAAIFG